MTASVPRTSPGWGGPLTAKDYEDLAKSWITPELADQAGLRRISGHEARDLVGQKGNIDCDGIMFPYCWPDESRPRTYRIRRDNPEFRQDKNGNLKVDKKYLAPPGDGNRLYIPPGVTRAQLEDANATVLITEGEKKGLALQRLAMHGVDVPRFIVVAIPGVWNWSGTTAKKTSPTGKRVSVKGLIADLERIAWRGRKTIILFDANVHTNPKVQHARARFASELKARHANVQFVDLPVDCGVNGVDDLLAIWGPERVLELFDKPVSPAAAPLKSQYESRPDGMYRFVQRGGTSGVTQLTTFQAEIVANIRMDDGAEQKREFELACELNGRQFKFTIPVSQFQAMDWPAEHMGSQAIIGPSQREHARTAIQVLSEKPEERVEYTHTGWRFTEGQWMFLHAGGAVGADGALAAVNVRLAGALSRFELQLPASPDNKVGAVQSTLKLLDLCPSATSFPVFAAVCRAVFGESDFALHLAGPTGAFKSELAALAQQFFGATMVRTNLPGSWSSTPNSIEMLAFHAKDSLVVVDDFAPNGNTGEVARYHGVADRVFRAAGNGSARGRLTSTAQLREPKPPRALILSTGEDVPNGQSIRARLLILEVAKGDIDETRLTECQAAALSGQYVQALGAFIQSLANGFVEKRAAFRQRSTELRQMAQCRSGHARTPDIIANLQAAFESFLVFCQGCGAIDEAEHRRLKHAGWGALQASAAKQGEHQVAAEPAQRFISLLLSCLFSGQAHLAPRTGHLPEGSPADCGWRHNGQGDWMPMGTCIGWTDGDDIFIEPSAAYQVVQTASRESGQAFPISAVTLRKRLREKGFLVSTEGSRGMLTVRRMIQGSKKEVLHLLKTTLFPADADGNEDGGEC